MYMTAANCPACPTALLMFMFINVNLLGRYFKLVGNHLFEQVRKQGCSETALELHPSTEEEEKVHCCCATQVREGLLGSREAV